jgi:hypothetical protein
MEQNEAGRQRAREKTVYRYSMALDRGDFATVAQVLEQAEVDPELEHMIMELNAEYRVEVESATVVETNPADLVRKLLREHLPSGFSADDEFVPPLTVGEVVARLEADQQVLPADKAALGQLRGNQRDLPDAINARTLSTLARELGIAASDRFWRAFQQTAIALGLSRSQSEMRLSAAREQRSRRQQAETPSIQVDGEQETRE